MYMHTYAHTYMHTHAYVHTYADAQTYTCTHIRNVYNQGRYMAGF